MTIVHRILSPVLRIAGVAIVLMLMPWSAWANSGIGYFMLALPILVIALLPAILVEACVLAPILSVSIKRALLLSFGANVRSTLWGIGLGIATDVVLLAGGDSAGPPPTKAAATVMLVPFFFLSWLIEYRVIKRRATDLTPRRIAVGTGAANFVSYAGMFAFVWMTAFLPERDPYIMRAQLSEAISLLDRAKTPLTEHFENFKRWPNSLDRIVELTTGKYTQSIVISRGAGGAGEIELTATMKSEGIDPPIAGTTVQLYSEDQGKLWKCRSGTAPEKYLPAACRR